MQAFADVWKGKLLTKRDLILTGDDVEDIELTAHTVELMCHGVLVLHGAFHGQFSARRPHLGWDLLVVNFGTAVNSKEKPKTCCLMKN